MTSTLTWGELRRQVAALAATFTAAGVGSGDRVVAYLPDTAESVVAFLAAATVGATWASCGQDYAPPAALDRLGQLEPSVLLAADGYYFAGREHDLRAAAAEVRAGLPSLRLAVAVPRLGLRPGLDEAADWLPWSVATAGEHPFEPLAVPFDHPLWVVFSSGTTGKPKGIVHGHGGVVLEHLKTLGLHMDAGPGDVFWWYTSPSWMMWNYRTSGLLVGATIVTYDGSPAHPTTDQLWRIVARHAVTIAGTSPGYVTACGKAGADPAREHDLSALRTLGCTGSTVPPESYYWVGEHVGERVQLVSTTGGTDVVTGFAGGAPTVPVWPGEISVACLGVALDAFDESGHSVRDDVGELVVTEPMPSMPVSFWNDPDGERYRAAYFAVFPGVWRHGDWITITGRNSVLMHGRSDSTLNRHGVRMGSAEIYHAVEQVPEVDEALIVGVEQPGGGYWMPLFVTLTPGAVLDGDLKARINDAIRTIVSPRHVPDEIILAPGVPHTRTGKKLEIPVKRLLAGDDPSRVADLKAVDDPAVFDWYRRLASARAQR